MHDPLVAGRLSRSSYLRADWQQTSGWDRLAPEEVERRLQLRVPARRLVVRARRHRHVRWHADAVQPPLLGAEDRLVRRHG